MMGLSLFFRKIAAGAVMAVVVGTATAHPIIVSHGVKHSPWVLTHVEMVMRHGIRSPLPWQVPHDAGVIGGWPVWAVPAGNLTQHGAEALQEVGQYDRLWLGQAGVLPKAGCPDAGRVQIIANSAQRTIASAEAFREGLVPGCDLSIEHFAPGRVDVRFAPLDAAPERFDMQKIVPQLPDPQVLYERDKAALQLLGQVVQCASGVCKFIAAPSTVVPDKTGHGLALSGPVADGASLAEALILAYVDGRETGWGQLTPEKLGQLSVLHADMLATVNRPKVLAKLLSKDMRAQLVRDMVESSAQSPALRVYVGHDDTIAPLLTALGVHVQAPGQAEDEVPVGSALILALYHNQRTNMDAYRVFFQAQSLEGLRNLGEQGLPQLQPLTVPECRDTLGFCAPAVLINRLKSGE
ncbi:histidine-type phosphatase [Neokomagataea anthophila]|uniref:Histidine-type phosphatase n=1 Tax=Neokomagataea anthophila TaxID=2826925 RepID=A0ABS5E8E1_9PROT|nr:histidine-type phosphatase [Neokomagataea anthophila]MBR0560173.1 histidine-type phosphatase [Neokomagataea anthophila]